MIFYFFTAIVFISELVIATAIIIYLLKLDKFALEYNSFLSELKPKIKELLRTINKISEQMLEFAPILVNKVKSYVLNTVTSQIKNLLGFLVFFSVKKEVEKRIS